MSVKILWSPWVLRALATAGVASWMALRAYRVLIMSGPGPSFFAILDAIDASIAIWSRL